MENRRIKNTADASVKSKTNALTTAIETAVEDIDSLLTTLRHEISVKHPRQAAVTLQVLAEAAARYAVTAGIYAAQLETLTLIQEVVNAEQKEENKEEKA